MNAKKEEQPMTEQIPTDVDALIEEAHAAVGAALALLNAQGWSTTAYELLVKTDAAFTALASARSVPQPTGTSERIRTAQAGVEWLQKFDHGLAVELDEHLAELFGKPTREELDAAVPPAGAVREPEGGWWHTIKRFESEAVAEWGEMDDSGPGTWVEVFNAKMLAALPSVTTPSIEQIANLLHSTDCGCGDDVSDHPSLYTSQAEAVHTLLARSGEQP